MLKKIFALAVLAILVGAAFFISCARPSAERGGSGAFVRTLGTQFVINGQPFRFVGANIAVMYRDEDRAQMPETLARASQAGIRVVRVWASGEGGPKDVGPLADFADWPRNHPFRWAPGKWNEDAFVHLDKVIAEASRNNILVQLCLANWWRDTGGITQYLRWAGINDAARDDLPFGIDPHQAMQFYTNEETRRLYREHIEKLATRRNTITGTLYREDPNIFGWELINEGQAMTGRWSERRAWIAEMSSYLKSLDPNHLITSGTWGYRTAAERREWLIDHQLPHIDYCDVHNYPRPDTDSFVDSPAAMREFVDNRAAAAFSLKKPLVLGEFGMGPEGYNGFSQTDWFRAFFESSVRAGAAGAMFWIFTPDPGRGYGVTYTTRDEGVLAEVKRAAGMFNSLAKAELPQRLTDAERHLVPRQFAWSRNEGDPATLPQSYLREDKSILYRFKPRMAVRSRFEKLGSGVGYIWGYGMGRLDYMVPEREDRRRISQVIVRAHMQPVPPIDARPEDINTSVTLFINGVDCGSRLVSFHKTGTPPAIQEWVVDKYAVRLRAMRGLPMTVSFAVTTKADWPYGVNISNWPEGYDAGDTKPLEVELRR